MNQDEALNRAVRIRARDLQAALDETQNRLARVLLKIRALQTWVAAIPNDPGSVIELCQDILDAAEGKRSFDDADESDGK